MAKLIKVWDGSAWQEVAVAASLPSNFNVVQSTNGTLLAGRNYFVDTTAARTLTLPASPSVGDTITIYDASGTAATNNITIARNGSKINGQTEDAIIDVNQASSVFVYTGATVGWRFD
jgi:VCBS repeat-containing protein